MFFLILFCISLTEVKIFFPKFKLFFVKHFDIIKLDLKKSLMYSSHNLLNTDEHFLVLKIPFQYHKQILSVFLIKFLILELLIFHFNFLKKVFDST